MTSLLRNGPLILALALVALLLRPAPAEGHALLLRAEPVQDARLFEAPDSVTAWFSEPLEAGVSSLKVVDATGRRVDSGATEVDSADPTRMSVALPEELGPGFYLVTWETLSRIDGHFRFGSFQFAVLNPDGSLPPAPSFSQTGGGDGLELDRSLVKALSLIAQAGLVGALAFFLFVARPAAARQRHPASASALEAARGQLWSAALASSAMLAVAGAAGLTVQAIESPAGSGLGGVLSTSWGDRWLQRQALLLLVAAFLIAYRANRGSPLLLWPALIGGVAYLALTSASSHGAAIERGSLWATALDLVHLLAAAAWVGGLAQLVRLLFWSRSGLDGTTRPPFVAEALRRFSLLAATAVVPLLASGVLNAFIHVPRLSSLVDTDYGIALTAKLVVVALLLTVAGVNAFLLRPGVVRAANSGHADGRLDILLGRLVAAEAALGLAVFLVTGFLTQLTTARALAQIAGDAAFTAGSGLANPLISGSWGLFISIMFLAFGVLGVIWTREATGCLGWTARNLSRGLVGVPVLVLLALAVDAATPPSQEGPERGAGTLRQFQPQLSLLLQADERRFVSLQAEPFAVGDNTFRVTVLDSELRPSSVGSVALRFSRLERNGVVGEVKASPESESGSYFADFSLQETGWWDIEAVVDGRSAASFYVRLDQPSRAPDSFAPPGYPSDPKAEELFERALATYRSLSSVAWSEELTSGEEKPSGYGVWYVTVGEAVAPDQLHFQVLNQDGRASDRYYVGSTACSQIGAQPFECSEGGFTPDVFELDYLQPAAFKLGREELVDGEMIRIVLFYNPNQQAWYAWWVGLESGLLRRQAMVATGHFMLTRFEQHNGPLTIQLPENVQP